MKRYFVEWDYASMSGPDPKYGTFEWFETEEEMEAWVEKKEKGNGGYFILFRKGLGDYAKYEQIVKLNKENWEMSKKIEENREKMKALRAEI